MIIALLIALLLLLLLGAVVWFWQRRLYQTARTEFNPVMRPEAPPATQLRAHEPEVWRPPSRQQLLQHQRQVAAQRGQREVASQRFQTRRQRVVNDLPDGAMGSPMGSPVSPLSAASHRFRHAPSAVSVQIEPREVRVAPANVSTRLDRKRQGLDSLITEWSSDTTDHAREH